MFLLHGNTNLIVLVVTRSGLEPMIYCTWGKHAIHYTTDTVEPVDERIMVIIDNHSPYPLCHKITENQKYMGYGV
jgi:hypothetical protein